MTNISDILKFWNRHHFCPFKTRSSFPSVFKSFVRCFPNPKRVTADWSVGCCCSPSTSLCILPTFSTMNQLKKLAHCSCLNLSHTFSHFSFLVSLISSISPASPTSPLHPPSLHCMPARSWPPDPAGFNGRSRASRPHWRRRRQWGRSSWTTYR